MDKTAAGHGVLSRPTMIYAVAFLLVKAVALIFGAEIPGHFVVATVLVALPLLHQGRRAIGSFDIIKKARSPWAGLVCFGYVLVPVTILVLFYPNEWLRARMELERWVFSAAGLSAIILAPLAEEFFFRGWLLDVQLKRATSSLPAGGRMPAMEMLKICYFNGLFFWLMHIPLPSNFVSLWSDALSRGMIPLSPGPFLLGLTTTLMTISSGTPRFALVFHVLANSMGPLWWPLLMDHNVRSFFYF